MTATNLFDDVTAEVAALDLVTEQLGGRLVDHTDAEEEDPDAWRGFDDRTALEDQRYCELMLTELADAHW
jgi:hypothetical protein